MEPVPRLSFSPASYPAHAQPTLTREATAPAAAAEALHGSIQRVHGGDLEDTSRAHVATEVFEADIQNMVSEMKHVG